VSETSVRREAQICRSARETGLRFPREFGYLCLMTPEQNATPPQPPLSPPANPSLKNVTSPASEPVADPNSLSPDEQMARFEQELKETDWGHQPC
jgi:hypothetical protein